MTDTPKQLNLMPETARPTGQPVECLGQTFENDTARREHYLNRLREGLEELNTKLADVVFTTIDDAVARLGALEKWPVDEPQRLHELAERIRDAARGNGRGKDLLQLWKDEVGFPHGEIDDILRLSDPPYYTACPNPFIGEFIAYYGRPYDPATTDYRREPFAVDVSEGKGDAIYNAHGYHTKVPHRAIMRYIMHYTNPGDVVLDGFCGTGMTGVAAQLCGSVDEIDELGITLTSSSFQDTTHSMPKFGNRYAVLCDLSPIATFISSNYTTPIDMKDFAQQTKSIIRDIERNYGWMYLTLHQPTSVQIQQATLLLKSGKVKDVGNEFKVGAINYVVWSEVFLCPNCSHEIVFWTEAVDISAGKVRDVFPCPNCGSSQKKSNLKDALITVFDSRLGVPIQQIKQVPVLVNYSVGKSNFTKAPDIFDLALVEQISSSRSSYWTPTERMPEGDEARRNDGSGLTHVHHFYTERNLRVISALFGESKEPYLKWLVTGILQRASKQHQIAISRVGGPKAGEGGATAGHRRGTLYVPSNQVEFPPLRLFEERVAVSKKALNRISLTEHTSIVSTQSVSCLFLADNSVDYIFTDPPFGGNIMYPLCQNG